MSAFDAADLMFEAFVQTTTRDDDDDDDDETLTRMADEVFVEESARLEHEADLEAQRADAEAMAEMADWGDDPEADMNNCLQNLNEIEQFTQGWITNLMGDMMQDLPSEYFSSDLEEARTYISETLGGSRDVINDVLCQIRRGEDVLEATVDALQQFEQVTYHVVRLVRGILRETVPRVTRHISNQIEEHKAAAREETRIFFRDFPQILAAGRFGERSSRLWLLGCGLAGGSPRGGILALRRSWAHLAAEAARRSRGELWERKSTTFMNEAFVLPG